jgi:trigger factor
MNAAASNDYEVSLETMPGLERRMTVRVPAANIEREVAARLAKVRKTAKLKGFRPGKVPDKVVRQYYGGQVREEVLTDVIRASYSRAIAEQNLNPAGGPRIEPLADGPSDGGRHFAYRATFEVYPEIALAPTAGLAIDVPKIDIEDADVDAMIEKLRAQRAEWRAVERPSVAGDRVVVDFVGKLDGEPFEGGEGKEIGIVIGAGKVIADFDAALHGVAAGESKTAAVTFPADYAAANLAGRPAEFEITVHRVEERVLPPVDEAFIASFGVAAGTVDELKKEVRSNMARELGERVKAEAKTRAFDALLAANRIAVPRALIEQEIASLHAEAVRQAGGRDAAGAPPPERLQPLALRRVTVGLLVQELLKQHQIRLDSARVEQRVKELAAAYEKPEEAAQFYRSNRGMMTQVEATVLEDQVVDFLLAEGKVNEQKQSFEEFMGA